MQNAYDSLPELYKGYRRITSEQGGGRVGVMSLENFYLKFTGLNRAPRDNMEWVRIPERFLATVTNGEVFLDNLGTFSAIRRKLKEFYPQDVVKKKLAARCAVMAQSGQYNYGRSMRRGDSQAAYLACGEFVRNSMSAIYILNETYMPYYKWMFRGAQKFNVLGESVDMLREITMIPDTVDNFNKKEALIESVCVEVAKELNQRGFTKSKETFLQAQGEELMRNIDDTRLKSMHIMADYN